MSSLPTLNTRRLAVQSPVVRKPATAPRQDTGPAPRRASAPAGEPFRSSFNPSRERPRLELNPAATARQTDGASREPLRNGFVPARDPRLVQLNPASLRNLGGDLGGIFDKLDTYRVPNETTDPSVPADEAQRTPEIARNQEEAVQRSLESGEPVRFVNSNGQVEEVSVRRDGDDYVIKASDGHELRIHPEEGVSDEQIRGTIAALTDYYTQVPSHLRDSVDTINLHPAPYRANYNDQEGDVVNLGLDDIDEVTFDHEFGHAIGYTAGYTGDNVLERIWDRLRGKQGIPEGWEEAAAADGSAPSEYSHETPREDFGESWLAYVEARELGPEALAEFEAKYPNRARILEQVYEGTWEG